MGTMVNERDLWLIVVTGWTAAGKSTIADEIAARINATVASFDWVMSGLRSIDDVWPLVEQPVELQRRVGWNVLSRIAEQQLRRGSSCVLDLVAREEPRQEWQSLVDRYGARLAVIECVCSDETVHRSRVEGRQRLIPGWYELNWEQVARCRRLYIPLAEPKLVVDAVDPLDANLRKVLTHLDNPT